MVCAPDGKIIVLAFHPFAKFNIGTATQFFSCCCCSLPVASSRDLYIFIFTSFPLLLFMLGHVAGGIMRKTKFNLR